MRQYRLLPSWHLPSPSASHRSAWSGWDPSSATVDRLSLMYPLYFCLVFSHFHFWPQDPVQVYMSSLVTSSEAPLGFGGGLSDSPFCWGSWCNPIIWQRWWIFRGDSRSDVPHLPREAIVTPATSHWGEWQTQDISGSPMWGLPATPTFIHHLAESPVCSQHSWWRELHISTERLCKLRSHYLEEIPLWKYGCIQTRCSLNVCAG